MDKNITFIEKPSIEMVKGFYTNGIHCGLKKDNKLDLGIVLSEKKAKAYAMYTVNLVKGAPLIVTKEHLEDDYAQALVVNSKIANTCTGKEGINNSKKICKAAADCFNIDETDVIPMSTGVIGAQLPVDKICDGIKKLSGCIKEENPNNFTGAIMTTDTFPKIRGVRVNYNDAEYTIIGTAKGSGMIHPNMATLLAFFFTDANISHDLLKKAFIKAVDNSFNCITVDGDTSTNDTALILANGMADNNEISDENTFEFQVFCEALSEISLDLAKLIVKDGEGITKFVEIIVNNAKTEDEAKKVAMTVANSNLVKTAFFGEDPNWGRIICAVGYSNVFFDINKFDLYLDNKLIFSDGSKADFNENDIKNILQNDEFKVIIDLKSGDFSKTVWTCDLSYDYIKINADYRT